MAMLEYLRAKNAEYDVILSWIANMFHELETQLPEHRRLIARLREKLTEAEAQHNMLQALVNIGHPRLIPRALPIIHDLEFWTFILTCCYLPALQKEDEAERVLRKILLSTISRCGLAWVEDIAIRLDGQQATVPIVTEMPVVIAPPQCATSLLDMPGLYHEFGHTVFQRFPTIADGLAEVVSTYFSDFRQRAGPMNPARMAERDRVISKAMQYWDKERLNEIFSDIFGTFTCGPAHYVSCVDMALKSYTDPFCVDPKDMHPPLSARIYACYNALALTQQVEQITVSAQNTWNMYVNGYASNAEFRLVCSDDLLDCIVRESILSIERLLPSAKRYNDPLPEHAEVEKIPPNAPLEEILNRAAKILLSHPESYATWEAEAFNLLKSSVSDI